MASIPNVKPGFTTSEWWSHILTMALAAGVGVAGVVHPGYVVPSFVSEVAVPAAAALAAISTAVYTHSRTKVKTAALARPVAPVIAYPPMTASGTAAAFIPATDVLPAPTGPAGTKDNPGTYAAAPIADNTIATPNPDAQTVAHPGAQAAAPPLGE